MRLLAARHVEHVALAEQLLGALLAQDGAGIDLAGDGEGDARRQVCLDDAGDDVDRRALRRHDQVDAGGARLLRQALDEELHLLARRHHQIGQLVHHHRRSAAAPRNRAAPPRRWAGRSRRRSRSARGGQGLGPWPWRRAPSR